MLCEGYHAYAYPLDVTCHASVMHLSDDLHLIYRCATGQMHVSDYLHLMHEVQVSHDLHHMHICQMPCIRWISVRCYITRIHIRWLSSAIRVSDHSHLPYLCWVTLICLTSFAIHHLPYIICHTSFAIHHLPYIICHTWFALHDLPYIICHTQAVRHTGFAGLR